MEREYYESIPEAIAKLLREAGVSCKDFFENCRPDEGRQLFRNVLCFLEDNTPGAEARDEYFES